MRLTHIGSFLLVLPLLPLAGCGDGQRDSPRDSAPTVQTASMLPDHVLQRLMQRYPVLGTEPAPAPQPSDSANPDRIPERLRETLPGRVLASITGEATFYASKFEGRRTASGIPFRQNQMVAAHRAYPFGTILRVTNLRNDRSVQVRVVDRGPFGSKADAGQRVLDLSQRAARQLGFIGAGTAQVRVEVLEWGKGLPLG